MVSPTCPCRPRRGSRGRTGDCRARGCAPRPRGCSTAAPRDAGPWSRSSVAASGTRTKWIGRRPCQAPSAIVQPAMWNSGNMQTVPPPPGVVVAPTIRAQPVRAVREHDALRPPGAPAREEDDVRIALVELGVPGRRLRCRSGCPARNGMSPSSRRARRAGARASGRREEQPRRGRTRRRAATSSTDARAFSGAKTAPSFASAPRTPGPPRVRCRPTTAPGRRARSRCPRSPLATRFAVACRSSPNVIASSSSVAAIASGATCAPRSRGSRRS